MEGGGEVNQHPYMPRELQLPDFIPNFLSQSTLLSTYGLSTLLVVSLVWIFSGFSRRVTKLDRLIMCWWAFTGLTHIILEGYFAFSPEFYKEKTPNFLAEVWKEYSKADSRYASRGSVVVAVEGLTAVIGGPLCLLALYAIGAGMSYSHVLQIAISLGQLYGTVVYYLTAYLDGDKFCASPFYYYAYYIGANMWWVLIPSLIIVRSWMKICSTHHVASQKKTKTG